MYQTRINTIHEVHLISVVFRHVNATLHQTVEKNTVKEHDQDKTELMYAKVLQTG